MVKSLNKYLELNSTSRFISKLKITSRLQTIKNTIKAKSLSKVKAKYKRRTVNLGKTQKGLKGLKKHQQMTTMTQTQVLPGC